ncbi:MAG: c-type cytochrome, partial [Nitrospiraceae bacterium]
MKTGYKKKLILSVGLAALYVAGSVVAKPGTADKGAEVYAKRCVGCHGEEGDGSGPAAER